MVPRSEREIAIVGKADPKTERRFARRGLAVASTQMISAFNSTAKLVRDLVIKLDPMIALRYE